MDEILARYLSMLAGREHGLFHLRLIIQPLVAALLAIRAGLRDARENRTAYGWAVLTDPQHRRALLREGWNDVAQLFLVAVLVDALYQIIVFRWIHPVQALIIAGLVALPAYLLLRGPANRIVRIWLRGRDHRVR